MFDILWTSEVNELDKMATEDEDLSASVIVKCRFFSAMVLCFDEYCNELRGRTFK